jgi:purine-binding chemotaxis protein CheW
MSGSMNKLDLSKEKSKDNSDRFLEFTLGEESYAIPLLKVREVIAIPKTTPIPNTPSHFVGIMNLRGQVISVLDIRKKMGITPNKNQEEAAVVIVDLDPVYMGIVVDSVNKVLAPKADEVGDKPKIEGNNTNFITGTYRSGDKLTVFLDIGKALNVEDLEIAKTGVEAA